MTECWHVFHAYNTQTLFGFGTDAEAEKYVDRLNGARSVNHYAVRKAKNDEAAVLELNDSLGFNLGDEIASLIADQGDWA